MENPFNRAGQNAKQIEISNIQNFRILRSLAQTDHIVSTA